MARLEDMTVIELKALAYDQAAQLEQAQRNLKVINQEIANKLKEKNMDEEVVATPEVAEETPVAEEVAAE